MKSRICVWGLIALLCLTSVGVGAPSSRAILMDEYGITPPIEYSYFPSRQHAFVWRNWSIFPETGLASILETDVEHVRKLAFSMGLPPQPVLEIQWQTPWGVKNVLRRNWQLLPYAQLQMLFDDVSTEEFVLLMEDDSQLKKIGYKKSYCQPLRYEEPTDEMLRQAAELKKLVHKKFGRRDEVTPRFIFMTPPMEYFQCRSYFMEKIAGRYVEAGPASSEAVGDEQVLRLMCPSYAVSNYFLWTTTLEKSLCHLASAGCNGIWIHAELSDYVTPEGIFPGTEEASTHLAKLRRLVDQAARHGIDVYLYIRESQIMPQFYKSLIWQQPMETPQKEERILCASSPEVWSWIERAVEHIFREVPGLGGAFSITTSKDMISCTVRGSLQSCEWCRDRSEADLVVGINQAISSGVHRAAPEAKVLVWDWGWNDSHAEEIISRLPKSCWLVSVDACLLDRNEVLATVGEYALPGIGPSPRVLNHMKMARRAGLKAIATSAKVVFRSSWEMAVVPSVPILDFVNRHEGGTMSSWSFGGYPSVSLELFEPDLGDSEENVLLQFAEKRYGRQAAPFVTRAWKLFSEALADFPHRGLTLYRDPQYMGPANLFYTKPMFKYCSETEDMLDEFRSMCPAGVFIDRMEHTAEGIAQGCKLLERAVRKARGAQKHCLKIDLGRARAVAIHCASSANQARFVDARNRMASAKSPEDRTACIATMRRAVQQERKAVERLLPIVQRDATIGYEFSNHYFYIPQDLIEKLINLHYVDRWLDGQEEKTDQI